VFGDLGAWRALSGRTKDDRPMTERILWGKLMPWEKDRGERMLNLITQTALGRLRTMRGQLAEGGGVIDYVAPEQNWRPVDEFIFYSHAGREGADARQKAAWLATTYSLEPGVGLSGTFAAAQLAEFEAWRRATLLLLALEAHRIEHGALPKSLDELVGPYLGVLPLDPYSGLEFDYFPAGLPQPATPLEAAELTEKHLWPRMSVVIPGKPCIWCTGPHLLARKWQPQGESEDTLEKPKPVVYYESRDYWDHSHVLLPYRAWSRGYWFPIPDQRQ
jgi:hypothetical protein